MALNARKNCLKMFPFRFWGESDGTAVPALSVKSLTVVWLSPIGDCARVAAQERQAYIVSTFRNFILQFAQDLVHNPVYRCGAHAVTGANRLFLQVFDDVMNQRKLHVVGIRYDEFFAAAFRMQGNGVVGEYRETNLSFVADDFDTCLLYTSPSPRDS